MRQHTITPSFSIASLQHLRLWCLWSHEQQFREDWSEQREGEDIIYIAEGLDSNPLEINWSLCFTYKASVSVLVEKQSSIHSMSFPVWRKAVTASAWSPGLSQHGFTRSWERNRRHSMGLTYTNTTTRSTPAKASSGWQRGGPMGWQSLTWRPGLVPLPPGQAQPRASAETQSWAKAGPRCGAGQAGRGSWGGADRGPGRATEPWGARGLVVPSGPRHLKIT